MYCSLPRISYNTGWPVIHGRVFLVTCKKWLVKNTRQVTFYRVPEKHGHVYLVRLVLLFSLTIRLCHLIFFYIISTTIDRFRISNLLRINNFFLMTSSGGDLNFFITRLRDFLSNNFFVYEPYTVYLAYATLPGYVANRDTYRQRCIKFPTTWYSSQTPFFFIIFFPKISALSHLMFFRAALIL